jgi:hypothetical protein
MPTPSRLLYWYDAVERRPAPTVPACPQCIQPCTVHHLTSHPPITQQCRVNLLDSFRGTKIVEALLKDPEKAAAANIKSAQCSLVSSAVMLVVSIVTVYLTNHFGMIRDPKLSFFPVLGIIWFGTSLTAVAFTTLKFKAAKALAGKIPPPDVLTRVLLQREVIKAVHEGIKKGVTSSTATKAKAAESASATKVVPFTDGKGEKEGGGA